MSILDKKRKREHHQTQMTRFMTPNWKLPLLALVLSGSALSNPSDTRVAINSPDAVAITNGTV